MDCHFWVLRSVYNFNETLFFKGILYPLSPQQSCDLLSLKLKLHIDGNGISEVFGDIGPINDFNLGDVRDLGKISLNWKGWENFSLILLNIYFPPGNLWSHRYLKIFRTSCWYFVKFAEIFVMKFVWLLPNSQRP